MKAYATQANFNEVEFIPPQTDFHTNAYVSKITSIITKKDNIVPATATESWDISEAGDGSVMAYVEDDGSGNSTYKLTIGGKGGIIANESMIGYFFGFYKMTSIDLSALDTSEVTDMRNMFQYNESLTNLDLSNFDTSQVTNMSSMFYYCRSLTSLDVSKFDTSNVVDMSAMFYECSKLTSLDLSSFDTSQVTDMGGMFGGCSGLTSLDVSNFDISNVTNMDFMFCDCPAWNTVDQTKFSGEHVGGSCAV